MPWDEFNSGIAELDGADVWFSGSEIVLLVGLSSASEINPSPLSLQKRSTGHSERVRCMRRQRIAGNLGTRCGT
jgi:hypothetical protein